MGWGVGDRKCINIKSKCISILGSGVKEKTKMAERGRRWESAHGRDRKLDVARGLRRSLRKGNSASLRARGEMQQTDKQINREAEWCGKKS